MKYKVLYILLLAVMVIGFVLVEGGFVQVNITRDKEEVLSEEDIKSNTDIPEFGEQDTKVSTTSSVRVIHNETSISTSESSIDIKTSTPGSELKDK